MLDAALKAGQNLSESVGSSNKLTLLKTAACGRSGDCRGGSDVGGINDGDSNDDSVSNFEILRECAVRPTKQPVVASSCRLEPA